jgi:hypothetical protein
MDRVRSLAELAAGAVPRGYAVEQRNSTELLLQMTVVDADGRGTAYRLLVICDGTRLVVREDPASHVLPVFCPDRHIIDDGNFCMYWEEDRSFDVVDESSAVVWLEILEKFLRLQQRASYLGHWPSREVWAHGVSAARHQQRAEAVAAKLDLAWPSLVLEREMRAVLEPGDCIRVYMGPDQLFSTWSSPNRFTAERKHRVFAVAAAGKHSRRPASKRRAKLLRELAWDLLNWSFAEKRYWDIQKDRDCCGTMDTCELRKRGCNGNKV